MCVQVDLFAVDCSSGATVISTQERIREVENNVKKFFAAIK
jgi:hypothetical protein